MLTSLYLIRSNRRLFARLALLSNQRREVAQQMIATREATLREISRELHDEFGQILTAMGSMLSRAGRHTPEGSPLRAELREIGEITQTTLDNVRGLSQSLHPSILEEAGLEQTIEWYLSTLERQLDLAVSYERSGTPARIDSTVGIHVYRVLQEALNNVARHSGSRRAWVRLRFDAGCASTRSRGSWTGVQQRAATPRARPRDHARTRRTGWWHARVRSPSRGRHHRQAARADEGAFAGVSLRARFS